MQYYLKKFWKQNLLALAIAVVLIVAQIGASLALMGVLNSIVEKDFEKFLLVTGINLVLWVVMLVAVYFYNICEQIVISKMNNLIKQDISLGLLKKSYLDYHQRDIGEYSSWYTNDINQIEQQGFEPFFAWVQAIIQLILSLGTLFFLHWSLGASTIVLALVMLAVPKLFSKKMQSATEGISTEQETFTSRLKDALSGYDVVKFFGLKAFFLDQMRVASEQLEKQKIRFTKTNSYCSCGMNMCNVLCQAGSNIIMGTLSIAGIIPIGVILGGGNLVGMVFNSTKQVSELTLSFMGSEVYFKKFAKNNQDTSLASGATAELPPVTDEIAMHSLSFSYNDKPVLEALDFTFAKGKKYALIGPSGCGKSTVLKILLGILPDYQGSIFFDGVDGHTFQPDSYYKQMAYIGQDVFLYDSSILDNIVLGHSFTNEQIQAALCDSALDRDLQNFSDGLQTNVGENGRNLSGGQKQRVAIARALIHQRSILLVDEGTSALDKANAELVEDSLLQNPKLTLILVSHHLDNERKQRFDYIYDLAPADVFST